MTIVLPPEIEQSLREEARRRGTTPELLALDGLRRLYAVREEFASPKPGETLFEHLSDYIGAINGTTEALSEECGERFTEGLIEKQQQGRL